jgi:hypothetical protein
VATEQPDIPDTPQPEGHKKDDFTLKQWDRKIEEEEARWRHLNIDLNQMQVSGHDMFFVQAKVQALTNIVIEGDLSEENLNLNLKMIVYESMFNIRTAIEPQIAAMKAQQSIQVPEIIMPWQNNKKSNGS